MRLALGCQDVGEVKDQYATPFLAWERIGKIRSLWGGRESKKRGNGLAVPMLGFGNEVFSYIQ